jgi:5-(carboxyamino)imidazole ribonucleotide synthase
MFVTSGNRLKNMSVVGVVGGGQLARMMIPAAINLGIELRVLAESDDSAARLAVSQVGDFRNLEHLRRFARGVDVLTFDHEHVPLDHLRALREEGVDVFPPPEALALTQDKTVMRKALQGWGIAQPRWSVVTGADDSALNAVGGFPCIAKMPVGGYDGKGVMVARAWGDIEQWLAAGPVLLEELVDFRRELAQLSARSPSGQWEAWLPVETVQEGGVCSIVKSPASGLSLSASREAARIAQVIAESAGVVGVLAVELFEDSSGELLVNELAMRPHNSGHVFTEQSVTSQFEQHLRAVTNCPLGSTDFRHPFATMVNVFGAAPYDAWAEVAGEHPAAKLHSYQKAARPGRKAGHIVVTGVDGDTVDQDAIRARDKYLGEI